MDSPAPYPIYKFITGVITQLLSGMSHQVMVASHLPTAINIQVDPENVGCLFSHASGMSFFYASRSPRLTDLGVGSLDSLKKNKSFLSRTQMSLKQKRNRGASLYTSTMVNQCLSCLALFSIEWGDPSITQPSTLW